MSERPHVVRSIGSGAARLAARMVEHLTVRFDDGLATPAALEPPTQSALTDDALRAGLEALNRALARRHPGWRFIFEAAPRNDARWPCSRRGGRRAPGRSKGSARGARRSGSRAGRAARRRFARRRSRSSPVGPRRVRRAQATGTRRRSSPDSCGHDWEARNGRHSPVGLVDRLHQRLDERQPQGAKSPARRHVAAHRLQVLAGRVKLGERLGQRVRVGEPDIATARRARARRRRRFST